MTALSFSIPFHVCPDVLFLSHRARQVSISLAAAAGALSSVGMMH